MTTKDRVLVLLRSAVLDTDRSGSDPGFVSGGNMSKELGVTRASVNKAIRALRNEGYEIESVNNRGYKLKASPDMLNTAELLGRLPKERMKKVLCLESVSSTNIRLSELAYEGAEDSFVVVANEQTSGRGRRGRSFASPKDKGIYLSYLMRRKEAPSDVTGITAWTAVAVLRAIETVLGFREENRKNSDGKDTKPGIKWVNDIVMNTKKLCGILTEMSVENETGRIQSMIIGIGVNVNEEREDFDGSIRESATSLRLETGKRIPRAELAAEMIRQLDRMNRDFPEKQREYLEEYRENSVILGKMIDVYDARAMDVNRAESIPASAAGKGRPAPAPRTAKAVAINDDFSLRIEEADGTVSDIDSGEISIRIAQGIISSSVSSST